MKYSITILIAINCMFGYAQEYKEKFKADICNCLDTEIEIRRQIRNAFDTCFNKNLPTYATIIDASLEEGTPVLKYQKGQLRRTELKFMFLHELVYSCDLYFQEIEAERQRQLAVGRSRTYPSDLEKLNQTVALHPHPKSYMQRARTHFYLGNLKEAEADVLKSLEVNPYGQQGLYTRKEKLFLAWILEEQKRYKEAVTLYNESYAGNFDIETPILKAIAHKKAGGKQATTMQIVTKPINNDAKETETELESNTSRQRRSRAVERRKIETTSRTETTNKAVTTKKTESKPKAKNDDLRRLFKTKKAKTKKDNG